MASLFMPARLGQRGDSPSLVAELVTSLNDIQQEVLLVQQQQQQQFALIERQSQQLEQLAAAMATLTQHLALLAPQVVPASPEAVKAYEAASSTEAGENESPAQAEDELPEEVEGSALQDRLNSRDEAGALEILKRREVPGINDVDERGNSVLHIALRCGLPHVALAIVGRSDFKNVNSSTSRGWTSLHVAAKFGYLMVCQAILWRADFTEPHLRVASRKTKQRKPASDVWAYGKTAAEIAEHQGHSKVADFLRNGQELQLQ